MNSTLTQTQQPLPPLQREDRFTPPLPSHPGVPQGERHWEEGHWGEEYQGEGYRGACCHLPIQSAATDPHPHPRCFRLPQLLSELAPPGEVFPASQAPNAPAH